MSIKQTMNQTYSELCQKLGSLAYRKLQIDKEVESICAEIKALNDMVPAMEKLEAKLASDVAAKEKNGEKEKGSDATAR